jgi:hypothetical protein
MTHDSLLFELRHFPFHVDRPPSPGFCSAILVYALRLLAISVFFRLLHFLPQAQWPHIGPYFFDIGQAFWLRPSLANISPTEGVLPVRRPYRVLLFMIYHDLVDGGILFFLVIHFMDLQLAD